jgi:hypothetical protein
MVSLTLSGGREGAFDGSHRRQHESSRDGRATVIIIAPVYQPGHSLLRFVTSLRDAAPDAHVAIVDDGSAQAHGRCTPLEPVIPSSGSRS